MSTQFHNRLVGVTILVTSIIIFLPSIIDGKKSVYKDDFVSTPIKPPIKAHTHEMPATDVDDAKQVEKSTDIKPIEIAPEESHWEVQEVAPAVTISEPVVSKIEKNNVLTKPIKPERKEVPEHAWTIQLGAFKNAKNINALLKKLHKAGFQAHTIPNEVVDGALTRVFVGPNVSKKTLEEKLSQLKDLTKLQGKLIPFNAVNP